MRCKSDVRILTLHQKFFLDKHEDIDGLEQAAFDAEEHVEEFGLPVLDVQIFHFGCSPRDRFRKIVKRILLLLKIRNNKTQIVEKLKKLKKPAQLDLLPVPKEQSKPRRHSILADVPSCVSSPFNLTLKPLTSGHSNEYPSTINQQMIILNQQKLIDQLTH